MDNKKLTSPFKYLVFDCFGTLVDWETGIYEALLPLLSRSRSASKWTRKEALQAFGSVEFDLQAQHPEMLYSDLLAKAHEVLEARLSAADGKEPATSTLEGTAIGGSSSGGEASTSDSPAATKNDSHRNFAESINSWPIFSDTIDALRRLSHTYKLIILSNVDRESFGFTHARLCQTSPTATISGSEAKLYEYRPTASSQYWSPPSIDGVNSPFTLILTAQDTKAYKPSLVGFNVVLGCIEELEGGPANDKVLSVAQSLRHDHEPAHRLALDSVWINRKGAFMGLDVNSPGQLWTWRFETLGAMADAVEQELRG